MTNHHTTHPRPTPACAAVAPLLARVIGQKRLDQPDEYTLQTHLQSCEHCRAELDSYHWLDDALARHFAPPASNPLSPAEIRAITNQTYRPRSAAPTLPARPAVTESQRLQRPRRPAPASRKRRSHRLISALGALAAIIVIAAISLALLKSHLPIQPGQGHTPSPTAHATASLPQPTLYAAQHGDVLNSIFMLSASDGWAVGSHQGSTDPLILHYTSGQWQRINNPTGGQLQLSFPWLSQVWMVSPTEGWAVGNYTDFNNALFGLILHYTNGIWTVQKTLPNDHLNGLAMLSASDGWAVGDNGDQQQSVLLHYIGGAWMNVPLAGHSLNQIVMTSPTDGWIVEQPQFDSPLWHYNGTTWTALSIPGMYSISLLSMVSPSDGWAVGFKTPSSARMAYSSYGGPTIFAHYDGKTWKIAQTYTQDMHVTGLSMDGPDDGWAVGSVVNGTGAVVGSKPLYLHYTGGHWTQVNGPDAGGDDGLTVFMDSSSDGWAVEDDGAILHYSSSAWTFVINPAQ
jgi:hypothetical protein